MSETPSNESAPHADWTQVGAAFTALGDRIQAHFSGLTASAPSTDASAPFEQLGKSLDEALTSFRNAVSDPDISDAAKSAADQLLAALRTEVDSASDTVSGTLDQASESVSTAVDQASQTVSGALDQASDKVTEITTASKDAASDAAEAAMDRELPAGGDTDQP